MLPNAKWEVGSANVDNEVGSGKNPTSHFSNPGSHLSFLTSNVNCHAFSYIFFQASGHRSWHG